MSYIDTFDHEFVGFFGGLPIYHPLESVTGDGEADFGCTPEQLVLGGGGGEHPGMVLLQPAYAVSCFIQNWINNLEQAEPARYTDLQSSITTWETGFIDVQFLQHTTPLHFAGWQVEDYHQFLERCMSPALMSPFEKSQDGLFETWLLANLGELIFFAMPELVPNLDQQLPGARTTITQAIYLTF